eukprot:scaffold16728_cov137-Isochrysis_galbana.AAC.2
MHGFSTLLTPCNSGIAGGPCTNRAVPFPKDRLPFPPSHLSSAAARDVGAHIRGPAGAVPDNIGRRMEISAPARSMFGQPGTAGGCGPAFVASLVAGWPDLTRSQHGCSDGASGLMSGLGRPAGVHVPPAASRSALALQPPAPRFFPSAGQRPAKKEGGWHGPPFAAPPPLWRGCLGLVPPTSRGGMAPWTPEMVSAAGPPSARLAEGSASMPSVSWRKDGMCHRGWPLRLVGEGAQRLSRQVSEAARPRGRPSWSRRRGRPPPVWRREPLRCPPRLGGRVACATGVGPSA